VKCVLLAECGSHAVVGLEMDRYDDSEVHGAHRLLSQVGPNILVLVDAGIISYRMTDERLEIELVIDEIKTHERAQRKVLRSKTPEGVRKAPLRHLPGSLCRAGTARRSRRRGRTGP